MSSFPPTQTARQPLARPSRSRTQFLLLLEQLGRRRLRALWQAAGHREPLTGERSQREALFAAVAAGTDLELEALPWQALADRLERSGIFTCIGADLPAALRAIPDPPLALYGRGAALHLAAPALAVVGARRASARALRWTQQTCRALAEAGLTIVSGMAFGVDAAAHEGAFPATLAVLGSGLQRPSPRAQLGLFERLCGSGGCVVSEYPLTQEARKYSFPERNRLITGLACAVLVVEAGARSGSLISARLALEQGRDVLAVPGPVGLPGSVGCHRLIKQGAALVEHADDVLDALGWAPVPGSAARAESPDAAELRATERRVLAAVDGCVTSMEALVLATGLSARALSVALTELELGGFVHRQGEGYIRAP
ncbi:MAG: DNA-processing protein DprA [Pseudomonadota bacterium]